MSTEKVMNQMFLWAGGFFERITVLHISLVNKSVSRETIFCNAPSSGDCLLPALLPDQKSVGHRHMLVGLLHFGLRPVQQDRLRICPLQCRQRQQNISLTCVHKAGLSFAKILNWDGLSRQMSEPKWTKSKLRQTFQRLSRATEG